jgi:CBS domain-containing protein
MPPIKDFMTEDIVSVDPDDTVEEVISLMLEHGISGLPVVDMSGQLVGVVTEFDLLDMVWDPNTDKNKVYHYMTRDVYAVDVDDDFCNIVDLFGRLSVRRLPVMEGDRLVGIVSRRDLLRYDLQQRCTAAGKRPGPSTV